MAGSAAVSAPRRRSSVRSSRRCQYKIDLFAKKGGPIAAQVYSRPRQRRTSGNPGHARRWAYGDHPHDPGYPRRPSSSRSLPPSQNSRSTSAARVSRSWASRGEGRAQLGASARVSPGARGRRRRVGGAVDRLGRSPGADEGRRDGASHVARPRRRAVPRPASRDLFHHIASSADSRHGLAVPAAPAEDHRDAAPAQPASSGARRRHRRSVSGAHRLRIDQRGIGRRRSAGASPASCRVRQWTTRSTASAS